MSENVLTIENATMQFGGVVAVDNLNLKVDKDHLPFYFYRIMPR